MCGLADLHVRIYLAVVFGGSEVMHVRIYGCFTRPKKNFHHRLQVAEAISFW